VDSLEGVTHALRTNEYRERNAQYQWMIKALGMRGVDIWDFRSIPLIGTAFESY
jgi:glutamyl-tRNA synthetase